MMDTAVTAAAALQEDKNNTTCGKCDSEVKAEKYTVVYDICNLWFHIGCQGMSKGGQGLIERHSPKTPPTTRYVYPANTST